MGNNISSFMSRDHRNWDLPDIFKNSDSKVYLIEDKITHEWLSIDITKWTVDPNDALSFPNYFKASTFANRNNIYGKAGIIITEHLFLDPES